MSVEETQQPSFTVTAGILPSNPISELSTAPGGVTRSPSPSTCDSVANRFDDSAELTNTSGPRVEEEQSDSLQLWTATQQKANRRLSDEQAASITEGVKAQNDSGVSGQKEVGGKEASEADGKALDEPKGPTETQLSSAADVPDPTDAVDERNAELDNVSTPTDSSPAQVYEPTSKALNGGHQEPDSRPSPSVVKHARTPLQPVNDYSPHKSRNFAIPSPSRAPLGTKRRIANTRDEQDSFADHPPAIPKPPVERLTKMLEGYKSIQSDALDPGSEGEEDVPGWEASLMKARDTIETEPDTTDEQNRVVDSSNGHGASDPSQASQSVPQVSPERPPDPSLESPTSRWIDFPNSPPSRPKRFAGMLDSQSSESMPNDFQFSQHDDLESQHSIHSIPIIATQSMPRQATYLSSPPASPDARVHTQSHSVGSHSRQTHSTVQTTSSSLRRQSTEQNNTMQEPTQLVTEDEAVAPPSPPPAPRSPISAGQRRALPSARAWRAGRTVISQPADRSRMSTILKEGPSTVATPQAVQALRQATTGPPPALEDTFVDPDQAQSNDRGPSPNAPLTSPSSPPLSSPQLSDQANPVGEPLADQAMEATFIDPTVTSLPPPAPQRTTPRQYGKQKAVQRKSPSSPTPRAPATPPPTAGPSRIPAHSDAEMGDVGPSRSPSPASAPRPAPTKSGRIPKRKRRDSSASMSGSSSSSEELDPLDESYRPVLKTGTRVKGHSSSKAVNPNLKRVKRDSRSSSTSRRTSGSTSAAANTSTPLTTPPSPSSPSLPVSNYVLAYWHPNWYIGRVRGMTNGRYEIDFEDETFTDVATDRVRRGLLRKGDKVKTTENKTDEFEVMEDWQGEQRGVKIRGGRYIPLKKLFIRNAIVKSDFTDRIISPRDLGFDADVVVPPPRPASGPIKPAPTSSSDIFAGKLFIITSMHTADSKYQARQKKFIDEKIVRNGGKYFEQWEDLFDLPASGFGSTLTSTSAPFLLQETQSAALTPKMLVSLAKGIPCLSVSYIDDAIDDPSVDWRSYLVESGYSEKYQQHCSQMVSGTWGKVGWNAATAQAERRPFLDKTFLFLLPKGKKREIKKLVLVCLHAMGASNVEVVNTLGSPQVAEQYDYVLVEDRDEKRELPAWARSTSNVCNIQWLKQCLVMGAALNPGLLKASE